MKSFDIEERVQQAVSHFNNGYNCCQAVFMAYADLFDIPEDLARNISVSFGGGIGQMREVCGTVSGMAMLCGFKYPVNEAGDKAASSLNYRTVQKMAARFKEEHQTILCKELLPALAKAKKTEQEDKTSRYYTHRPCGKFVISACRIAGEMLKENS